MTFVIIIKWLTVAPAFVMNDVSTNCDLTLVNVSYKPQLIYNIMKISLIKAYSLLPFGGEWLNYTEKSSAWAEFITLLS